MTQLVYRAAKNGSALVYEQALFGSFVGSPAAGGLTITGTVPVRNAVGFTGTPDAGALVINGTVPSLGQSFSGSPVAQSLVITGSAFALTTSGGSFTGSPSAGNISILGANPVLVSPSSGFSGSPGVGQLFISGQVPVFSGSLNNFVGVPNAGQIIISGTQPDMSASFEESPAAGNIAITGTTPVLHAQMTGQLSGRGVRRADGLTHRDWQAFTEYKARVREVRAAKSARAAKVEVDKPRMPTLARLQPHELGPTAKALKVGLEQLREAVAVAQQAEEEDDLQALMLID